MKKSNKSVCVSFFKVTNDIFTKEDGEFLVKHGALPEERIRAVETGGCPHAAIREDISINLGPLEELSNLYKADLLLCESGGGEVILAHTCNLELLAFKHLPKWVFQLAQTT